jgi:hypothetical protein
MNPVIAEAAKNIRNVVELKNCPKKINIKIIS